jgi:hypothetical protein
MLTNQCLTHEIIKSRVRAEFLIAELSHIFRGVLLCQYGPVSAWCFVIMVLCWHSAVSAGAVSTWQYVGIVLCHHGRLSAWCCVNMALCRHSAMSSWPCVGWCFVIMALYRHGAVSTWHCVSIALCHHGPVLAGAVSTWCDFLDCWNLNIQINSRLDSDFSSYHSVQNILSSCLLSRDKMLKLYCTVIIPVFVWVWTLASYTERWIEAEVVQEYGTEGGIWT